MPRKLASCSSDSMQGLAKLLGKGDKDAFRPADVGETVTVLVLHFANEFGSLGAQARYDSVDIIHGEHDATDA
jgi:hypothetical protein